MSILNNSLLLGAPAAATGYSIPRSLRFNSSDSAYLSRTPASAGNLRAYTFAFWIKRTEFPAGISYVYGSFPNASTEYLIGFNSSQQFYIEDYPGSTALNVTTAAVFRDPSAWYHFVVAVDTTQATASNRIKLYVNGSQITQFASAIYPTQNYDTNVWNTGAASAISARGRTFQNPSSHYLADIHFIDSQALTPLAFGEFDANGIWQPKAYTGTYGTNGFRLNFADNSAATAAALGKDTSGNGNNWTPNNLSVTAGAGNDSLVDSPTNGTASSGGDAGGVVVGNYAVLNPLAGAQTLANGNLDFSNNTTDSHRPATIAMTTGKWYCEMTVSSSYGVPGLVAAGFTGTYPGQTSTSWGWYGAIGIYNNAANIFSATYTANDIIQIAFDADSGKLWFGKNGTWLNSGNPAAGTNQIATPGAGTWCFAAGGSAVGAVTLNTNFGQRPFAYAAPAGFKSLNTANLPTPTILNGATAFDTKLYTGNGSTQTISGLGFSPDFVWIKTRSIGYFHVLYDSIRGTGTNKALYSNTTNAEGADTTLQNLTSFNSDGFSLGTTSSTNILNDSSQTRVAWCWDAGTSTVTNNSGTITSSVRANASAGFSVVGWNYPSGTPASTIGHGLGVKPSMIILKNRDTAGNWIIYHTSIGATKCFRFTTAAASTESDPWNNTEPTSTVFSMGAASWHGAGNMIAYCFAPVAGYSAMGSYVGNGQTSGVFVWTGFRPRWILIKKSSATGSWYIIDTARDTYNQAGTYLYPDLANAEADQRSTYPWDILGNGFIPRAASGSVINDNGATYVYFAIAENPFSIARAR